MALLDLKDQPIPEDLKEKISQSGMVAYLWRWCAEAKPYTLKKAVRASTSGSVLKGELINCLVGSVELPEGTEGWVFRHPDLYYSAYRRVFDEDYPAAGADILESGCAFTFVCAYTYAETGDVVLASHYEHVKYPAPRIIGKVPE